MLRLVLLCRTLRIVRRIRPLYLSMHGLSAVCKQFCGLRFYLDSWWCEDQSENLGNDIKTGEAEVEELNATIDEEIANAASLTTKI